MKEQTINKVNQIVALYATMVAGHLTNSDLPPEEQMAGILCAGDLVTQATTMAIQRFGEKNAVGPAWTVSKEDIGRTAIGYAKRMIGDE